MDDDMVAKGRGLIGGAKKGFGENLEQEEESRRAGGLEYISGRIGNA
jgi:hypothetical protein